MTGAEHYQEAERIIASVTRRGHLEQGDHADVLALAQVHATLAHAAAVALSVAHDMPVADHDAWWAAAGSESVRRAGTDGAS